ncbi:MAG: hypothetical protein WD119_00610 [Pirellulaceae bacterium]
MSEDSPYQVPASVVSSAPLPAQQRPTGVTVFGILSIVLGLFFLMGTIIGAFFMVLAEFIETGPNPVMDTMEGNLAFQIFSYGSMIAGTVFTSLLVVAGVGMLKMKAWSRKLSVVYSLYAILSAIAGLIVNVGIVFGPALNEVGPGPERVGVLFGLVSTVLGTVVGVIYPIALLVYCWRRETIAMFESWR